jgi:hypothetical protein
MQADIQDVILKRLSTAEVLGSAELQKEFGLTHEALYAELISLVALNYIKLENQKVVHLVLTAEGLLYANQGTPEARIFIMSSVEGTPRETVEA